MLQVDQKVTIKVPGMTEGIFKGYRISPLNGERSGAWVKYLTSNPERDHGFGEKGVALFSMNTIHAA